MVGQVKGIKINKVMKTKLILGDCIDKLKELESNSVDSIVTDPPYGLEFMGKKWDYDVPSQEIWEECIRVLKPGGHLLSFGGSRTYHRMAVRIEDAGFEIRDQIMWIYGSGFPKSHNIGKSIDKKEGNEREVVGETTAGKTAMGQNSGWNKHENRTEIEITKGTSQWEGWGTALKPAHEPIVMARKPLIGTVANNVLEWGVGGINIDGCRIGTDDKLGRIATPQKDKTSYSLHSETKEYNNSDIAGGRFPANIILDEEAGKILDEQSGDRKGFSGGGGPTRFGGATGGETLTNYNYHNDTGGASRFFYCPKSSKRDRNEGVEYVGQVVKGRDEGQDETNNPFKLRPSIGATFAGNQTTSKIGANPNKPTEPRANIHPTVKPTELMKYLIRLVTPKGGIVLDPFMGSGSTGKAAVAEGMEFIGIEREKEYYEIAEQRINHVNKPKTYEKFFE